MAVNKRLLQGAAAAGELVPSEHFGVVLYEGDGSSSHSINGGKFGAAFYGNGSNSRIDSTSIGAWPSGNAPRSISFWMYSDSYADGGIVAYGTAASNQGFAFYIGSSQLIMTFYAVNANINYALSTGQWYHVVATHDGTTFKAYINGSEEYSDTRTLNTGTAGFRVGGVPWNNSSEFFNGKIDQVRVFQKALSSSEVSTLYAETVETVESLDPLSEDTTDTLQVLGDSSCIATYRFENDETDLSGNYDGTGAQIQYAAGRYGQAASFNGTSSYVQVGTSDMITGTAFSVSIWVIDDASSGYREFFSQQADNNKGIYIGRHTNSGTIRFNDLSISCTLGSNWNHLSFTVNGSTLKTYQNGSLIDTKTNWAYLSSETARNGSGVRIGRQFGTYSEYWLGKIDQLRVFNKELSAAEVTTLYNENSLVASYRFEGNANDDTRNYDGTATNVTYEYGLNFTPDFVWIKNRTTAASHIIHDSTRGAGISKNIYPDFTGYEGEYGNYGFVSSFDTGGFTVDASTNAYHANRDGDDYVAWCLKANGGTTSSNTDGSITSTVQANQDAGFSIVKYTGTGSLATVGHGLSSVPELFIIKNLDDGTRAWLVYDKFNTATNNMTLNTSAASAASSAAYNNTEPTSTVFTVNTSTHVNAANDNHIAYCFRSVDSFSKIGSYTGNGSSNGPIIETGFEPAFLMIKRTDSDPTSGGGGVWIMYDNKRSPSNPRNIRLWADNSAAEFSTYQYNIDFLSNGFQLKDGTAGYAMNTNGGTYIYMAFAADPDTEAPTVAKSFSTVAWSGDSSSTRSIDGLGFSPSLVWIKNRTGGGNWHHLSDIVRGGNNTIFSNATNAATSNIAAGYLSAFEDDGFELAYGTNGGDVNATGSDYVAWAWKADDNEPTINTEGTIDTLVSANANAGFSIVNWTGGSSGTATTGHGLSASPEFIIQRPINTTSEWYIWHKDLTSGNSLKFTTAAESTDVAFTVNSSVFYTNWTNTSYNWIAYCFHSVAGYSKIGSYAGNGTSQTVTLGFRPDFVMLRKRDDNQDWFILDSVRGDTQPFDARLKANTSDAETTSDTNIYATDTGLNFPTAFFNDSGKNFIYMAFKIN